MAQYSVNQELETRIRHLEEKLQQLRVLSEDESQEETGRFKVLAEAAFEGIFLLEDGYCIEANPSGCLMFGYTYEEIIGLNAASVFTPEYRDLVQRKIRDQDTNIYEAEGLRKDGSTFFALVQGRNLPFYGRIVRVSTVTDITEQKKAREKILESRMKYRSLVENAADGILLGNLEGNIIEVNNSFLKMTGYSQEELLNQHVSCLFDLKEMQEKPLRFDLLNNGEAVIFERDMIGKSGQSVPIEMNSKRLNENIYLSIIRDLREHRKAQEDLSKANKLLIKAKEKAEESDRLKSAFLANMSHEIRTPLNGIVGFAELLKDRDLPYEEWSSFIDVIISSGQQLLSIINDVLAISRIETGQIVVQKNIVDLQKVMNELYMFFRASASNSHNELIVVIPEDQQCSDFFGDSYKITQIMTNLINNALKFTWGGVVRFGHENDHDNRRIHFFVTDNGIGIPDEALSSIFDRFVQVENQNESNQSGTGLGLAICKKMVVLMGGEIWAESVSGEGSTFHFVLPY